MQKFNELQLAKELIRFPSITPIDAGIMNFLQKKLNKKIVTLVWDFEKFYQAENYHQDYYEKNFIRYLMYKKGCQREETLKKIWN